MDNDKFPAGLFFNLPHTNAPDFVKGGVAIRPDVFIEWLKAQQKDDKGFVRLQFKEGKDNKGYAQLDTYFLTQQNAPQQATEGAIEYPEEEISVDDIPF